MPHFGQGAPGQRCIFERPVALTAALPIPTKHSKNWDFPPSYAAHPIFERMTGSILERIGRKKHPIIEHNSIYIYIYMCCHICRHIYTKYPNIHQNRVTPLSARELPHYPRQFGTANIGVWEVLGLFQLWCAVSEIMWVLVMVFLNMQVGLSEKQPVFYTAAGYDF